MVSKSKGKFRREKKSLRKSKARPARRGPPYYRPRVLPQLSKRQSLFECPVPLTAYSVPGLHVVDFMTQAWQFITSETPTVTYHGKNVIWYAGL